MLLRIRRALAMPASSLRIGVGDDAAVWRPQPGCETILTCDWFLEGTHFLLERHPPDSVGWKCLARAVSDLAAMGARPRCFLLSLALPSNHAGSWLDQFLQGLRAASNQLNCPAAGGDTTRRDKVLISVAVVGECPRGRALLRGGAGPGDAIFVTGRLGEAEYGLRLIRSGRRLNAHDRRLRKHLYPEPRLEVGAWLAEQRLATAMMDLSDGLSSDLPRLCAAGSVGARLDCQRIPFVDMSGAGTKSFDALAFALHGGDDYELLFTVSAKNISKIPRRITGTPVTMIGYVTCEREILLTDQSGRVIPLAQGGWDPFRK